MMTDRPEDTVTADTCGTVACFAGWNVLLAGDTVNFDPVIEDYTAGGTEIPDRAQHLLGLTPGDAGELFHPDNGRARLGHIVTDLFGPRPTGNAA